MSNSFLDAVEDADVSLDVLSQEELEFNRMIGGDFNVMSLSDEKQVKEMLGTMRKNVGLKLDGKKLKLAEATFNTIEQTLAIANDPEVLKTIKGNVKTAEDLNFLSKAMSENMKILQNLMRMDSIDGQGTAGTINVGVQFKGSNGSTTSVIVQAKGE